MFLVDEESFEPEIVFCNFFLFVMENEIGIINLNFSFL